MLQALRKWSMAGVAATTLFAGGAAMVDTAQAQFFAPYGYGGYYRPYRPYYRPYGYYYGSPRFYGYRRWGYRRFGYY